MLNIKLCTLDEEMYAAWSKEFEKDNVEVIKGDIFKQETDAVVTSANSFGLMDAGIDKAMCDFFGNDLENRVQEKIKGFYFGEIPVGNALVIETFYYGIPYMICAPTMRVPMRLKESVNVYLATRAALIAAYHHNIPNETIKTITFPGMGTITGKMPYEDVARQMHTAYENIVLGKYENMPADWKIARAKHNELRNEKLRE
ncbi:macro domain-containing protein [Candidatus Woesearchaeota archaeon]|nr:macro domain-containing protein [Candidatus Woesearchaeota archaeon]